MPIAITTPDPLAKPTDPSMPGTLVFPDGLRVDDVTNLPIVTVKAMDGEPVTFRLTQEAAVLLGRTLLAGQGEPAALVRVEGVIGSSAPKLSGALAIVGAGAQAAAHVAKVALEERTRDVLAQFERREIGSSRAAALLGLGRVAFLDLAAEHGVSTLGYDAKGLASEGQG
jgi:hypothetical protein